MKTSIIIPAYNEQETICKLVSQIQALNLDAEIIVVNDASCDNTYNNIQGLGITVINHPYRLGNGAAIKSGIRIAKGDILVFIDADFQHPPDAIPDLIDKIKDFDMVVGARTSKSKVSLFRSIGNYILTKTAEYLSQHRILDLTSGFRAIKKNIALEFIHLLPNGFSYPTTLTIALFKSGYFVNYVPLESIKTREKGKSKIKPFRNGFEFILLTMRLIMLFDPLRIFLPFSSVLIISGTGLLMYQISRFNSVKGGSILTILVGIFTFCFGLLADQSSAIRREIKPHRVSKE